MYPLLFKFEFNISSVPYLLLEGSLEVGVTSVPPEQMKFLPTAKDARPDTWMLSGSTMMCAGSSTSVDYAYDLNLVRVGSRVGVQRKDDGSLHYFIGKYVILLDKFFCSDL